MQSSVSSVLWTPMYISQTDSSQAGSSATCIRRPAPTNGRSL